MITVGIWHHVQYSKTAKAVLPLFLFPIPRTPVAMQVSTKVVVNKVPLSDIKLFQLTNPPAFPQFV